MGSINDSNNSSPSFVWRRQTDEHMSEHLHPIDSRSLFLYSETLSLDSIFTINTALLDASASLSKINLKTNLVTIQKFQA